MKLIRFALCTLMAVPFAGLAQKNNKPATLITSSNETVQGLVDDREWNNNPVEISFKANGSNQFRKYSANEAKSVKIDNGDYYVSKTVTIDKTDEKSLEVDNYLDSTYLSYKTVTVFLLAEVVSDKITLYSLSDQKLHLFAETPNQPAKELIHRDYRVRRNGKVYEQEDVTYIEQLKGLFADCPSVATDLADTKFTVAAVAKEVQRYITCGQGSSSYRKKTIKGKATVGFLAGTSISGLRFKQKDGGGSIAVIYDENFSTNPAIAAGLRFQYTLPGRQQKFSALADLYYTKYKGEKEKQVSYTSPTFYTNRLVEIEFSMLRLDMLFRYAFASSASVAPFVNAGISFSKTFGAETNSTTTEVFGINTTTTNADAFGTAGINSIFPTATVGGGAAFKKWSLEYRFAGVGRITPTRFYSSSFTSHQLMLCWMWK